LLFLEDDEDDCGRGGGGGGAPSLSSSSPSSSKLPSVDDAATIEDDLRDDNPDRDANVVSSKLLNTPIDGSS
jgi:hypothetical protein